MLKKVLAVLVCTFTMATVFSSCGKEPDISENSSDGVQSVDGVQSSDDTQSADNTQQSDVSVANFTAPQKDDTIITMNIRDYGTVKIRLFPEYADKGVENFIGLAEQGYYDGLTFHRVINDFMIQGGDPNGNGTGGESIWGGKFDGGTDPHLIHAAGALAYANSGATSTNGSQFYLVTGKVCTADEIAYYREAGYNISADAEAIYTTAGGVPYLDGNYTVFGQVFDGLDVIFKVQQVTTDTGNDKPMQDVIIDSVTVDKYNDEELKWYISDYEGTQSAEEDAVVENVPVMNYTEPEIGDKIISMTIKDYGEVKFRLFPEYADKGVENFIGLAEQGYYDGLTFHRIINDFMIQGGDPEGTGRGGESIWGGSFDGGTDPHLIHTAGAVAYANSGDTSTNTSQFYIVTGDVYTEEDLSRYNFSDEAMEIYSTVGGAPWLDGVYTIFGQVYDGLNVIFEIQKTNTDENDKPMEDVIIESMRVGEYDGSGVKWYLSDYEGTAENIAVTDDTATDDTALADETAIDENSGEIDGGFSEETPQ